MSIRAWMLRLPISAPLSLNVQDHHMVRAKKVKAVREATAALARAAKIPACSKIRVTLIYTPRDSRRRDSLNLVPTQKACEDGLVDAQVVPDDTPFFVESCMPIIDVPDKGEPGRLELYVEQML